MWKNVIMNENGMNSMKLIWLYLLLILIRLCTVVDYMIVFEYEWNEIEWYLFMILKVFENDYLKIV